MAVQEELVECHFLIPIVRDSDRVPHSPSAWKLLQDIMRGTFPGGHTGPETFYRGSALVPGEYEDPPVHDQSRRYTIALPRGRVGELREVLAKAANTFDQKTIYLSVAGIVEFIKSDPEGTTLWDIMK